MHKRCVVQIMEGLYYNIITEELRDGVWIKVGDRMAHENRLGPDISYILHGPSYGKEFVWRG